ncbi:MAG: isoprenylcysteine carboxylmethyltransferase family protein [Proteobacteria bacterium]|nr:isoprenylcysteine carboxylmethyltransferase family protein [Pseudomonadota bacterium]
MSSQPQNPMQEDDAQRHISEMSLVEIGERLFQWRDYIAIPILIVVLFMGHPTARTATIGTLLLLAGQALRVYAVAFLGPESNTRDGQTDRVISHGPFALVRNPLYFGNLIMVLGVLIYSGAPIIGFLTLIYFLFQYHCIVKYEESLLLAKFGEEYHQYMERVPAWIPEKLPTPEDFPIPPSFMIAIKAEQRSISTMTVILFLLMLSAG